MPHTLKLIILLLPFIALIGCTAAPRPLPEHLGGSNALSEAYRLGTGDNVRVTVFGQDNISGDYLIDSNGHLPLPLVQSIPAEGLTLSELKSSIYNALTPKYLNNPKITIEVIAYRDIYVLGEVRNPGKFAYIPNMTIMQAVAVAGGHTYRGNENTAEITRKTTQGLQTFILSAKSTIEPGDTIVIKRRWF